MQHEQCHFDIAKLFALKLEQKFRAYKLTTNVYYDLKSVYNTIVAERLVMDKLYDKIEKENPNTDVTQKKFERDIRKQLVNCKKKG
jgi:predicted secreted Zn-dependent protease